MNREQAYYNSELILLDYCIWQNLDNQAKETLIEGVQIGIDQIYDAHEAELQKLKEYCKEQMEYFESKNTYLYREQISILQNLLHKLKEMGA